MARSAADLISMIQTQHPICVQPVAATLSDSTADPAGAFCGFRVDVGGIVKFTDLDGDPVTVTVLAGIDYPYPCTRIWSTTTTATGISGLVPV